MNRFLLICVFSITIHFQVTGQTLFLGKGKEFASPEKVANFARDKIQKDIRQGVIIGKHYELVWSARTIQEFNTKGFDTVRNQDQNSLLGHYIMQEALLDGPGVKKISFLFCGKKVTWKGKIARNGEYQGRVIILPVIPERLCGCKPKVVKSKSNSEHLKQELNCETIHSLVTLDTILPKLAPLMYNNLVEFPPCCFDGENNLWVLSTRMHKYDFPSRIQLLKIGLKNFHCDTICVDVPIEQQFSLNYDIESSENLLSIKDSSAVIIFGNRVINLDLNRKKDRVLRIRRVILPSAPEEVRLISKDKIAAFSFNSIIDDTVIIGNPELQILELSKGELCRRQSVPFQVKEILQLQPNHYFAFSPHYLFTTDAFDYKITVFDSTFRKKDSLIRPMDWKTITPDYISSFNRERDSLSKTGRIVLSCSTVRFSLMPLYAREWDKITEIYAANDSTLIVVYKKKSPCNASIFNEYYKPSEHYIPSFYDIWQKNSETGKFELLHHDLIEYMPRVSLVSTKSNFPLNVFGALPIAAVSDSTIAVWNYESNPLGHKYSRLKTRLIFKVMKLSAQEEIHEKPSLYIYRIHELNSSDRKKSQLPK